MRTSLWPSGLVGRVGFVLFAAVILELLGSTFVFEQAELLSSDDARARRIAEQLDGAARVLEVTRSEQRTMVATTLSEPDLKLEWQPSRDPKPMAESDGRTRFLREKMLNNEPALLRRRLVLRADKSDLERNLNGSIDLGDGTALRFRATDLGSALPSLYNQFGSVIVLSFCVLLAALIVVRTLTAPLRMLVRATDAIGHGPPIHLDERGPREIRRVAQAFNEMQSRITKLIADRTQALAAVSHDLRTPISRMQLRAGFLASQEDQAAFEADLGEMEAMVKDLLAYLGGETDPEKPKLTDIATMLQTLTDDATDAGHMATYDGPDHFTLSTRALALKRAFSNIVNNAIAYGRCVRIELTASDPEVSVIFDDDGPGIPDAEIGTVFEPFYRGDASRNRATGGMGLGLAITRHAIWRENGLISLENRPEGGLRVTVKLPRNATNGA